jgi:hypothetical protein
MKPYTEKIKTGPYARIYEALLSNAKQSRASSEATPEDCARVMLKAIESPHPRPRYTVTRLAAQVRFLKRLLPDRTLDAIFRRRYKISRGS